MQSRIISKPPGNTEGVSGQVLKIFLWICGVIAFFAACNLHYSGGNAGDKAGLLREATALLAGKKIYVDFIEINPPFIAWLFTIPVFISQLTGIADFHVLAVGGILTVAAVIALSLKLLQSHPAFACDRRRQMQLTLLLVFIFIIRVDFSYFADRDDIFLLATFPYILRWLPELRRAPFPLWLRLAIGVLAAIGFCIKPHCMVVLAGIQLIYILAQRSAAILFCLENVIIYSGLLLYLACVFAFASEYLFTVLPIVLQTYGSFARRLDGLLYGGIAFFTLAVAFCEYRPGHGTPFRRDIFYFLSVSFFFLCYALANNGWGYSYNPLISYTLIIAGWLVWEFGWLWRRNKELGLPAARYVFGRRAAAAAIGGHVLFTLFVFGVVFFNTADFKCEDYASCMQTRALAAELKTPQGPRSFMPMTIVASNWGQVSQDSGGAQSIGRLPMLWILHKFFASDAEFTRTHRWILDYTATVVAEDIARGKPQVVFVDSGLYYGSGQEIHIDIPSYLSAYPAFEKAWTAYRFVRTIDYCHYHEPPHTKTRAAAGCRFDVYSRLP